MPMKNMGKPNLTSQLKSSLPNSVSRAGAQRAGKVGQIATNNKIVSFKRGGGHNSTPSKPKRGKRMY